MNKGHYFIRPSIKHIKKVFIIILCQIFLINHFSLLLYGQVLPTAANRTQMPVWNPDLEASKYTVRTGEISINGFLCLYKLITEPTFARTVTRTFNSSTQLYEERYIGRDIDVPKELYLYFNLNEDEPGAPGANLAFFSTRYGLPSGHFAEVVIDEWGEVRIINEYRDNQKIKSLVYRTDRDSGAGKDIFGFVLKKIREGLNPDFYDFYPRAFPFRSHLEVTYTSSTKDFYVYQDGRWLLPDDYRPEQYTLDQVLHKIFRNLPPIPTPPFLDPSVYFLSDSDTNIVISDSEWMPSTHKVSLRIDKATGETEGLMIEGESVGIAYQLVFSERGIKVMCYDDLSESSVIMYIIKQHDGTFKLTQVVCTDEKNGINTIYDTDIAVNLNIDVFNRDSKAWDTLGIGEFMNAYAKAFIATLTDEEKERLSESSFLPVPKEFSSSHFPMRLGIKFATNTMAPSQLILSDTNGRAIFRIDSEEAQTGGQSDFIRQLEEAVGGLKQEAQVAGIDLSDDRWYSFFRDVGTEFINLFTGTMALTEKVINPTAAAGDVFAYVKDWSKLYAVRNRTVIEGTSDSVILAPSFFQDESINLMPTGTGGSRPDVFLSFLDWKVKTGVITAADHENIMGKLDEFAGHQGWKVNLASLSMGNVSRNYVEGNYGYLAKTLSLWKHGFICWMERNYPQLMSGSGNDDVLSSGELYPHLHYTRMDWIDMTVMTLGMAMAGLEIGALISPLFAASAKAFFAAHAGLAKVYAGGSRALQFAFASPVISLALGDGFPGIYEYLGSLGDQFIIGLLYSSLFGYVFPMVRAMGVISGGGVESFLLLNKQVQMQMWLSEILLEEILLPGIIEHFLRDLFPEAAEKGRAFTEELPGHLAEVFNFVELWQMGQGLFSGQINPGSFAALGLIGSYLLYSIIMAAVREFSPKEEVVR